LEPLTREEPIINAVISRNILLSILYHTALALTFMYAGPYLLDLPYEIDTHFYDQQGWPTNRLIHYTMTFNTFVLQAIFQEICSRKTKERDFNIYQGMLSNWVFMAIFLTKLGL